MTAALLTDSYKLFHKSGLHEDIARLYGNFTNRSDRLSNIPNDKLDGVVFAGLQYFIKDTLIEGWNNDFFSLPKATAVNNIARIIKSHLGGGYSVSHFEDLWELGYLPIEIKAVPEGTITPYQVAPLTIKSTVNGFSWLPLYLETVMSAELWPISTSATTAANYLANTKIAFKQAGLDTGLETFMNHNFSYRGCFGKQAAVMADFGHLAVGNCGSDTIPTIMFAEKYYNADADNELISCSVKATEHSITTSFIATYAEQNGVDYFTAEVEYARKLLRDNPTGILSYVADSFDFWRFVEEGLPLLKEDILARDGTFVIRPDSGNPVNVLCGFNSEAIQLTGGNIASFEDWKEEVVQDIHGQFCSDLSDDPTNPFCSMTLAYKYNSDIYEVTYEPDLNRHDKTYYFVDNYGSDMSKTTFKLMVQTTEQKGLVESLYDIFGGTTNEKGIRCLDSHIGAIYGDSITVGLQEEIYSRLITKQLSPAVVLGVGSFSYQYVTRDTHGSAVKATAAYLKDGTIVDVCKDPKTDAKKKSAKGLLKLDYEGGKIVQYDQSTDEQEREGLLETVFLNGDLVKETTLQEIRDRVATQLNKLV